MGQSFATWAQPETEFDFPQVEIRPLSAKDTTIYRNLRSRIRQSFDVRFFSDSYTREDSLTEDQWLDWCKETPEHCIIGAFVELELVGIVMVTQLGNPEDLTAEWEASWLDPSYRGQGITPLMYDRVRDWTIEQGYKTVKVFIRSDNYAWLAIRIRQGFSYLGTKPTVWADGSRGDMCIFSLGLSVTKSNTVDQRALNYLQDTQVSLLVQKIEQAARGRSRA
jgi:GNAT superfamily N-acetyltransferase